jgi:hypothetical protein
MERNRSDEFVEFESQIMEYEADPTP